MKFLSKAIYCSNLKPSTYATCYLFELCQIVVTLLRDAFHNPMIKITYTPHILPTSTLEVVLHVIHSYSLQAERTWIKKRTHEGPYKNMKN